jgi:hypothetical protein
MSAHWPVNDGEDRCNRIDQGGKDLEFHLYSMEDNSEP